MRLYYSFYNIEARKGVLFFHQRSSFAHGTDLIHRIFESFALNFRAVVTDRESTKLPTADDLNDPEIQSVESAKMRALRSLPQSSLYWNSDMFNIHIGKEHAFVKVPKWLSLQTLEDGLFYDVPNSGTWLKIDKQHADGLFCSLFDNFDRKIHLVGSGQGTYRLAPLLGPPRIETRPCFAMSWRQP